VAVEQGRARAGRRAADATFSEGSLNETGLGDAAFAATVGLHALHFAAATVSAC